MVIFGRTTPGIYVHDMRRALSFYCDLLGFSIVFTNGSPVTFAVLRRDAAHIHLSVRPDFAGSCHTHIMLTDLHAFYRTLIDAHVDVTQPPKTQSWGLRDIVVADPDGNTFEFAEPTSEV